MKRMGLILIFVLYVSSLFAADTDQITITTYYPAPAGSYNELRTYNNTYLATDGGRVGIGTMSPGAKLHVVGASASNAFVVATNTSTDIGVVIKPGYRTGIASIQGTDSGLTMPASLSINPEGGNVGIGTTNLHIASPMNNKSGNLDVNDVYINSTGRWVSETTGKYFCIGWCNHRCSDSIAESPRIFSSPTDISGTYTSGSRIGCPGGWCREVISCTR